jgi:hypothetical protein
MIFIPHSSLNIKLAEIFLAIVAGTVMVLKPIAVYTNRSRWAALAPELKKLYLLSPIVALASVERASRATRASVLHLLGRTFVSAGLVAAYYLVFWQVYRRHFQPEFWDGYLAIPPAYCIGLCLSSICQLWGVAFTGWTIPDHHVQPYLSASLRDFWSHRWNTWVSDTFRELFFDRIALKVFYYVAVIFVLSGIYHEFLINIPYLTLTGHNLFGSMIIYFVLQSIGLNLERSSFVPGTLSNRLFMYMVVLGPAPLILNEALVHMIGLWPH